MLSEFVLTTDDLVFPGGNESNLAGRLNEAFRSRGWRESRVDTKTGLSLVLEPYGPAGETGPQVKDTEVRNVGYKVDNVRDRIALDVEWNAKDGNLDRDLGAYRTLYEAGLIDAGVIISRTQQDLRPLARRLAKAAGLSDEEAKKRLQTTTTTNYDKLMPRVTRGAAGGCPFLGVFICEKTWQGS